LEFTYGEFPINSFHKGEKLGVGLGWLFNEAASSRFGLSCSLSRVASLRSASFLTSSPHPSPSSTNCNVAPFFTYKYY
jgi:hypothetical protein